jgi:hypothetical protein
MTILVHCTGFRPVPLQMNWSILFCFFNKMRQNCPFCSKKKKFVWQEKTNGIRCENRTLLSAIGAPSRSQVLYSESRASCRYILLPVVLKGTLNRTRAWGISTAHSHCTPVSTCSLSRHRWWCAEATRGASLPERRRPLA